MTILRSVVRAIGYRGFGLISGVFANALIARSLGPEALGASAMLYSALYAAQAMSGATSDVALVREYVSAEDKNELIRSIISWRAFAMLVAVPVVVLVSGEAIGKIGWGNTAFALVLLSAGFALNPVWIWIAESRIDLAHCYQALQSIVYLLLVVAACRFGPWAGMDLVLQGAAAITCVSVLGMLALRVERPRLSHLGTGLRTILNQKYIACTTIGIQFYTALDIWLVARLVDLNEAGIYRSAALVTSSVNSILSIVPIALLPRILDESRRSTQASADYARDSALILTLIAVPCVAISAVISPWLIAVIFGEQFSESAQLVPLMIAAKAVALIAGPLLMWCWAMKKDPLIVIIVALACCLSISLNLILLPKHGAIAAAYVMVITELSVLSALCWAHKRFKK
jgi:O-antigen/teichoic acid export membrane protein